MQRTWKTTRAQVSNYLLIILPLKCEDQEAKSILKVLVPMMLQYLDANPMKNRHRLRLVLFLENSEESLQGNFK